MMSPHVSAGLALALSGSLASAQVARAADPSPAPAASGESAPAADASKLEAGKKAGNVLTFYGLRKLEDDPSVSDAEKLREWQAFIERAAEQTQYAKKAVDRWKNAARVRLLENARSGERDVRFSLRQRAEAWQEFVRLYPRDPEAKNAKKRAAFWTAEEASRLTRAAEDVERARRPKIERIRAWAELTAWVDKGPEARAANKRIQDLQDQLYSEAESVDAIARVDDKTKLAAWNDVLLGRPSDRQRRQAERRIQELSAATGPVGRPVPDAGVRD